MRPVRSQNVATSTTVASTPLPVLPAVSKVRIAVTVDTYISLMSAVPATTSNGMLVRASTAGETFEVAAGDIISAVTPIGNGTMCVTEMTA